MHADTAARWAAIWSLLSEQEEEILEVTRTVPESAFLSALLARSG